MSGCALLASESTIYVGGDFAAISGQPRRFLAALDATTGKAGDDAPSPQR